MLKSLVSEKVTFAAASGKKLTAIVVKYTDQVLRAEVQYGLPNGVQKEHLRGILEGFPRLKPWVLEMERVHGQKRSPPAHARPRQTPR